MAAIMSYESTINKYEQLANQSFLYTFETIEKDKAFVNLGTFKSYMKNDAKAILSDAKNTLDDDDAYEELENRVDQLMSKYANDYKKVLANNNQSTKDDAKTNASNINKSDSSASNENNASNGLDTDPTLSADRTKVFYRGNETYKNVSAWAGSNSTYSMCDMVCTIDIITSTGEHVSRTLGKLQTLSYSIFQNKTPVRVIGNMNAKDYVYGQRTIAGSLIFAVFNKHWLADIYDDTYGEDKKSFRDIIKMKNPHFIADEIPPFDITISFANEYGFDSRMAIYGVRLVNEGQTMSINDIYIENTYEYVATDIEYMDTLSGWQSSDRIGRRYNTAAAISSGTNSASDTPALQGEKTDGSSGGSEVSSEASITKNAILVLSEKDLDESDEKTMHAKLQAAYHQQLEALTIERDKAKEKNDKEQYDTYNKTIEDLRKQYQTVYSQVKEYYAKKTVEAKAKQN